MCCRCIGLGTMSDAVATVILPMVAPGFSGSKVTVPETPLALPLMDSSGASSLNPALLMPLGSLKSNVWGAASATPARVMSARTENFVFIICFWICGLLRFCPDKKGNASQNSRTQQGGGQKIHAGNKFILPLNSFQTCCLVHDLFGNMCLRPAVIRPGGRPKSDCANHNQRSDQAQGLFHGFSLLA